MIILDGDNLTMEKAAAIAAGADVSIAASAKNRIQNSRAFVTDVLKAGKPIYGVNTGFGFFANQAIDKSQLEQLQLNLIKSHAAGYGAPLSIPETRLAMALRLNVLVKGYTGVRYELCQALLNLIKADIYPVIPEYGSVGASGDLAPLAHLALPLIGLGEVFYKGKRMAAAQALKAAKLKPIKLAEKEGLGLVNGTQIMLSVGGLSLHAAQQLLVNADKIAALTFEAWEGNPAALNPLIHDLRGQTGQIQSAKSILKELKGSYLFDPKRKHHHLQDPYSLRCAPQIHGPSYDAINYAMQIVERELNAGTDNPLVFPDEREILSGGNFHGQALALAFDFAAMAVAEIGNVSERRLELLLNPAMSRLPAFLSPKDGLHSGYMAVQYLSASLVNENKVLANPACTDSIPGNVGIEDHVSMGMTSARKLKKIVHNTRAILAIEMLAAGQAIDLRKATGKLGKGTKKTYDLLRTHVPPLTEDRIVSDDVQKAINLSFDF